MRTAREVDALMDTKVFLNFTGNRSSHEVLSFILRWRHFAALEPMAGS